MAAPSRIKRGSRTKEEMEALRAGIIKRRQYDPELSPLTLAKRFNCSHVTVVKVLRDAGLYVAPPQGRRRRDS